MKTFLAILLVALPVLGWAGSPTLGSPNYANVNLTGNLQILPSGSIIWNSSSPTVEITNSTGNTLSITGAGGTGNATLAITGNVSASTTIAANSFFTGSDNNGNIRLGSTSTPGTPYINFVGGGTSTATAQIINNTGNTLSLFGANGSGLAQWIVNGNSVTTGNTQIASSGSVVWNGSASPSNSMLYAVPSISGTATGNAANVYLGLTDNLNAEATTLNDIFVFDNIGASASGNRTGIDGEVYVSYPPEVAGAYVGSLGIVQTAANSNAASVRGWPIAVNSSVLTGAPSNFGGALGAWGIGQLNSNANGYFGIGGAEFDVDLANLTVPPIEKTGVVVVDQSSPFYGTQGYLVNNGFALLGNPSWSCGFCAGKATGDWPITPTGTLFGAQARAYGSLGTGEITPQALYFMDGRVVAITSGGDAIAMKNFAVDGTGNATATSITTNGTVQAETSTLTGITISNGGIYVSVPTFVIQAPSSGTTATATVSAMQGAAVVEFGSTGSGYQASQVLTAVGGTGTAAQITVNTVDGSGCILTYTISNAGSYTVPPTNPVSFTGGTGNGALFEFGYTAPNGIFSIKGTGQFAATGAGFVVNDTTSPSGDTGTEPTFKVNAVTPQGGIEMPITLLNAGSVTSIASGTYHAMTGGTGTSASMQIGYAVSAFSVNPGSGYSAAPPPLITGSSTNYLNANLVAQMTPALAPLTLSGSTVGISGNTTISGNQTVTGLSAISNGLKTASGTNFATAASCTSQYTVVNAGTGGVILPGNFGILYYVWNDTGSTITVYTPAGATLGTLTSGTTGKWFAYNSTTYNPS